MHHWVMMSAAGACLCLGRAERRLAGWIAMHSDRCLARGMRILGRLAARVRP